MIAYAYGNVGLDLAGKAIFLSLYRFFDHSSAMIWMRVTRPPVSNGANQSLKPKGLFDIIYSLGHKYIDTERWYAVRVFNYNADRLIDKYYEGTHLWTSIALKSDIMPLYQMRCSVGTTNVENEPMLFHSSFDKSLMLVYQFWNLSRLFAHRLSSILTQREA